MPHDGTVGQDTESLVYFGDNLGILAELAGAGVNADLVYIDPPYATNHDFRASEAAASSMSGTGNIAYSDRVTGKRYLQEIEARIRALRLLMRPHASIYVHIDVNQEHLLGRILDREFGCQNRLASISRIKCNPKNFPRQSYGNIHDTILHYAADAQSYRHRPQPMNRQEERFLNLQRDGRSEPMTAQDLWVFKDPQRPRYPTQKPEAMLDRLIRASTDPGDLVLDCYAGSGSTLVAAARAGRRFIGIDRSPEARRTMLARLEQAGIAHRVMTGN